MNGPPQDKSGTAGNSKPPPAKKPADEDDDIEPVSVQETSSQAEDTSDIDKLIGRGLKLPPVQSDGHW